MHDLIDMTLFSVSYKLLNLRNCHFMYFTELTMVLSRKGHSGTIFVTYNINKQENVNYMLDQSNACKLM